MSTKPARTANDYDRIVHDARNALAAARAQVDLARRRLARRLPSESVDRSLTAALRSLDDLAALLSAIDGAIEGAPGKPSAQDAVVAEEPARPHEEHSRTPRPPPTPDDEPSG
jgi:hypothetical protein